jgi:hypothetical protein
VRGAAVRFACLVGLVGLLEGVLGARLPPPSDPFLGKVPFVFVDTFLVFLWCRNDSIERSVWPSRMFLSALAALTIVALPYYLFKTRGLRGGAKATGVFLLASLAYGIWVAIVAITAVRLGT